MRLLALRPGCARIVGALSAGAIIESGSNANGNYVQWTDGTQICWARLTATKSRGERAIAIWTYPAAFAVAFPYISGAADINSAYAATNSLVSLVFMAESSTGGDAEMRYGISAQLLPANDTGVVANYNYALWVLALGRWKA